MRTTIVASLAITIIAAYPGIAQLQAVRPRPDSVLILANLYIAKCEKKLEDQDKIAIKEMRKRISSLQSMPGQQAKAIGDFVSQLTIALADMKSSFGLTVASASLVQQDTDNPRVTNLFGAVLHSTGRLKDAAAVLELTLAQSVPGSILPMLNLANVYLDLNKDKDAKLLLDQVLKLDPDNREAYKALATYYFKKGNISQYHDALLKSSSFEGYAGHINHDADQPVDNNEVKPGDGLAQMEAKASKLEASEPLNTADLMEKDYPLEAKKIRDKIGTLFQDERMVLAKFPQIRTNSNQDYQENQPIVAEWMRGFLMKYENYMVEVAPFKTSADAQANGNQYAKDMVEKSLQSAADAMKFLKGVGGVSQSLVRDAVRQMDAAAKKQGVKIKDKDVDDFSPPDWDSGSMFAKENYRRYFVISKSCETFIRTHLDRYRQLSQDNLLAYSKKVAQENANHASLQEDLDKEHLNGRHGDADIPCHREHVRYIKALNAFGDNYYKSWVNLYIPDYTQKMKPRLEGYWAVCALYIKNMNDVKIVEREYNRVRAFFMNYSQQAITGAADGFAYAYAGSTEDEEMALNAAINAAAEEAQAKRDAIIGDFHFHKMPTYPVKTDDWVDWIGKNLLFEVSAQYISLKVTARSIEVEFWLPGGATSNYKVDMVDGTAEVYTAITQKFEFGVLVNKYGVGFDGNVQVNKSSVTKWDMEKGTIEEIKSPGLYAKGELKTSLGFVSATTEFEIDPMLTAKIASKINVGASGSGMPDLSLSIVGNEVTSPPVRK